jgi:putative transcriptional regulator
MAESLQGKCLLASPFMEDENFFRSVVFMVRHAEDKTFGLILNRPTDFKLSKVVAMVCEMPCVLEGQLFCGGPVEGPLIALHDRDDIGGIECFAGLKVTTDQNDLIKLFGCKDARLKLFDGYAGWSDGQLEDELKSGSWLVADIDADIVLEDDPDLWESLVRKVGQNILAVDDKIADVTIDPNSN